MRNKLIIGLVILAAFISFAIAYAQDISPAGQEELSPEPEVSAPGNITVDFRDADINTVLRVISLKSGVNIVPGRDVSGSVTIRLVDVPWQTALDTVLSAYDYTYERVGDVLIVSSVTRMTEQKKAQKALFASQPFISEVFELKYLNAVDVLFAIKPMLTKDVNGKEIGKAEVLYVTGPRGWEFGSGLQMANKGEEGGGGTAVQTQGTREEIEKKATPKVAVSRTLLVVDIPPVIERIRKAIEAIDVRPKQVLIETRIIEVNRNKLRDLGLDISTGTVSPTSFQFNPVKRRGDKTKGFTTEQSLGGNSLSSFAQPAAFNPISTDINGTPAAGTDVFSTGLNFAYRKLMGFEFEVVLHALEEDADANILSAPRILTLNNQEANILVGTKYPIIKSETSAVAGTTAVATASLDFYQNIGIQLKVVPQINAESYLNMIVHPIVSRITGYVSAGVVPGATGAIPIQYPILEVREAETQVLMKDGETIVIGGLLRDQKATGNQGIPFLKDIPILGWPFSRRTNDTQKIDLLIFITARIVDENKLEQREKLRFEENQKFDQSLTKESKELEDKRKKEEEKQAKREAKKEARKKKTQSR